MTAATAQELAGGLVEHFLRKEGTTCKALPGGWIVGTYQSEHGIGYRVWLPTGKLHIEQSFKPGVSGVVAMSTTEALSHAEAAVQQMRDGGGPPVLEIAYVMNALTGTGG